LAPRAAGFLAAFGFFDAERCAIAFPAAVFLPDVPGLAAAIFFVGVTFFAGARFFAGAAFFTGAGFFAAGLAAALARMEGFAAVLPAGLALATGRDFATGLVLVAGLLFLAAVPALAGLDRTADFFISSASPTCPKSPGDAPHAAATAAAPSSRPLRRDGGLL